MYHVLVVFAVAARLLFPSAFASVVGSLLPSYLPPVFGYTGYLLLVDPSPSLAVSG